MYAIPPLYTLLAVTLSMIALIFTRAVKSFSFTLFISVALVFIFCLLLRITEFGSAVVLDKIIKYGLWVLVFTFIQQTIRALNKPLTVEECAKSS